MEFFMERKVVRSQGFMESCPIMFKDVADILHSRCCRFPVEHFVVKGPE